MERKGQDQSGCINILGFGLFILGFLCSLFGMGNEVEDKSINNFCLFIWILGAIISTFGAIRNQK